MKYLKLTFFIVAIVALSFGSFACTKKDEPTQGAETSAQSEGKEILYWTCGMHPDIRADKPGNCPICNMKLMPVVHG